MSEPKEWLKHYLAPLEGATIERVIFTDDDELGDFPVLLVKVKEGAVPPELYEQIAEDPEVEDASRAAAKEGLLPIEVSRDPEGNGPGFLLGLPHPGSLAEIEAREA